MWDFKTGTEMKRFQGHSRDINTITVSSDGKYLPTKIDEEEICYWEVETGFQITVHT